MYYNSSDCLKHITRSLPLTMLNFILIKETPSGLHKFFFFYIPGLFIVYDKYTAKYSLLGCTLRTALERIKLGDILF